MQPVSTKEVGKEGEESVGELAQTLLFGKV
jgi:hypothetical protein